LLNLRLDRDSKTLTVSGVSTFAAKEQIKRLGPARFDGSTKSWKISPYSGGEDDLRSALSGFELEFEGFGESLQAEKSATDVPQGLSVAELIHQARLALEERFRGGVLVYGVITSLKRGGENTWLTLADKADQSVALNCAIWGESAYRRIEEQLKKVGVSFEVNLEVMFQLDLSLNRKNGNLSPTIKRIIPEYTLSKLLGERERTNNRLKEEGIFENNKRLSLPLLPIRLGVLTSSSGTVIHDFVGALEVGKFGYQLFWYPVSVQGREAKLSIVRGISELSTKYELDALLLFRGGGSVSDLAVFNDYDVAKAIATCPLPVLTAVGHQEDQSSAQDVSNRAFGVPRDIGKFLAELVIEKRDFISELIKNLERVANLTFELSVQNLKGLSELLLQRAVRLLEFRAQQVQTSVMRLESLSARTLERGSEGLARTIDRTRLLARSLLETSAERVETLSRRLPQRAKEILAGREREFQVLCAHVQDASPEVQLKRGYAIARVNDRYITSVAGARPGDLMEVEFIDGELSVTVKESHEKDI
jgi:exodeoxyribonuclease VII large subunit